MQEKPLAADRSRPHHARYLIQIALARITPTKKHSEPIYLEPGPAPAPNILESSLLEAWNTLDSRHVFRYS